MTRGLITWQWAPDRDPARQASQLLSLTCPGSTFQRHPSFSSKRLRRRRRFSFAQNNEAGDSPAVYTFHEVKALYAFLGVCEIHQPFALTALPGNS